MSINLYTTDLSLVGGTELYEAIEALLRLSDPPAERLSEGWTLDFKEQWSHEMLKHATAFANTFGGLLIVGVSEKDGKPQDIRRSPTQVGTEDPDCQQYFSEHLTNAHLSDRRMSPSRRSKQTDCGGPDQDESRPATAIQLRSLIEQRTRESIPPDTAQRLKELSSRFYVTTAKQAGTNEERKANRTRSSTSFTVLVRPVESLSFPFDSSTEDLFDAVIARSFPEVARRWADKQAERQEKRGGDWHGIEFWQNNLDFEMNWLFSPREVALVTQVNVPLSGLGS